MAQKNHQLVSVKNICFKEAAGEYQILENISFNINKGQIVTLIGPNGGGKSTLAKIIIGSLRPSSGKVKLASKTQIGYLPQKIAIDNTLPLRVHDFLSLAPVYKLSKAQLEEVVQRFRIEQLLGKNLHSLSGGEMQRVLFARALLPHPDLLILDEPTQGVDINGQLEFYQTIEQLNKEGMTILLISHDIHIVMQSSDIVLCLNRHLCCQGLPDSVIKNKKYLEMFGNKTKLFGTYTHTHDHTH